MDTLDPGEYYERELSTIHENVGYETAAAIYDTASVWASLAERLMFAVEREGMWSLDPSLSKEYSSACLEEPSKFSTLR